MSDYLIVTVHSACGLGSVEKVRDIVGLYLNPPDNALVEQGIEMDRVLGAGNLGSAVCLVSCGPARDRASVH